MEQRHGSSNEIDKYLDDVVEQIQYKPVRDEIKDEIAAHIEDRKEEYVRQGMDESKAWNKAIENMGDAVEIGTQINNVRKVQHNPLTVILIITLIMIGILGNVRADLIISNNMSLSNFFYCLYGVIIFTIVYFWGYVNIVKHARTYIKVIVGTLVLYLAFFAFQRVFEVHLIRMARITIIFAWELLSIPIITVMAYFNRSKRYKSIGLTSIIVAVIGSISLYLFNSYFLAANLILVITIYSILLYMIVNGMLGDKVHSQIFTWILSLVIVLIIFVLPSSGNIKYELQQCFYPEKVAQNYFDDSYNSILIKNLLRKANMIGTINLNQDELKSYYTGKWYFKNMDNFDLDYKMQFIDHGDVKALEDILPQHYQTNYRIVYWILKYGWIPSILILLIIVATYGMLIRMVCKIRNKFGKVLSFSCILTLVLQCIIYIMGNFGFQLGWFCNFPLISEGNISIITNACILGLACSAYRYDKVVRDEKINVIRDNHSARIL